MTSSPLTTSAHHGQHAFEYPVTAGSSEPTASTFARRVGQLPLCNTERPRPPGSRLSTVMALATRAQHQAASAERHGVSECANKEPWQPRKRARRTTDSPEPVTAAVPRKPIARNIQAELVKGGDGNGNCTSGRVLSDAPPTAAAHQDWFDPCNGHKVRPLTPYSLLLLCGRGQGQRHPSGGAGGPGQGSPAHCTCYHAASCLQRGGMPSLGGLPAPLTVCARVWVHLHQWYTWHRCILHAGSK